MASLAVLLQDGPHVLVVADLVGEFVLVLLGVAAQGGEAGRSEEHGGQRDTSQQSHQHTPRQDSRSVRNAGRVGGAGQGPAPGAGFPFILAERAAKGKQILRQLHDSAFRRGSRTYGNPGLCLRKSKYNGDDQYQPLKSEARVMFPVTVHPLHGEFEASLVARAGCAPRRRRAKQPWLRSNRQLSNDWTRASWWRWRCGAVWPGFSGRFATIRRYGKSANKRIGSATPTCRNEKAQKFRGQRALSIGFPTRSSNMPRFAA